MEAVAKSRTQRINHYVSVLKRSQPDALESELKTMYLRAIAQQLDGAALNNNITMQDIVEEVNAVRRARHEK